MAFSRTAALRSCFRGARPTVVRPQLWRHVAQRGYASGGHEQAKAGGDALWAAGAVAVTVPSCWYILSQNPDASHNHDDHGGHGEKHGGEHEKEAKEESTDDAKPEEKSDEGTEKEDDSEKGEESDKEESGEKSEESDSGDEKEADTPETSEDESEDKPKSKDDGKNVKMHIPDAKGGSKNRLESKKGIKAGELDNEDGGDEPSDKATASKPAGGRNTRSGKQEGLTNTDTKHSYDITNDPTKSKKGEGAPDPAKLKGTVDPRRPQPEAQ